MWELEVRLRFCEAHQVLSLSLGKSCFVSKFFLIGHSWKRPALNAGFSTFRLGQIWVSATGFGLVHHGKSLRRALALYVFGLVKFSLSATIHNMRISSLFLTVLGV
jgi:hypothetical protein